MKCSNIQSWNWIWWKFNENISYYLEHVTGLEVGKDNVSYYYYPLGDPKKPQFTKTCDWIIMIRTKDPKLEES